MPEALIPGDGANTAIGKKGYGRENTFASVLSFLRRRYAKNLEMPAPLTPAVPADRYRRLGLAIVFLWFLIGGIAHFAATATEMRIVPPYLPWPRAAVLVSGVFELLGAAGLLFAPLRQAAGIGLFLLTCAVTPAHIYMLERPELFAIPYWALVLRLPVQVALLALIAWSTRVPRSSTPGVC